MTIPKIIHQIWIGEFHPPLEWMNTWKNEFCKKYDWEYKLWDDTAINDFDLVNKKEYLESTSYQQKSDIARYEIICKYGGLYLDCDMLWLGHDLSDYIPFSYSNFVGFQEYPSNSLSTIGPPYIANGIFASIPEHPILKRAITQIPQRVKINTRHTFIKTGPTLLNKCVKEAITLVPYQLIFPHDFHIEFNEKEDPIQKYKNSALIFTHNGFSYPHMKKLRKLGKI